MYSRWFTQRALGKPSDMLAGALPRHSLLWLNYFSWWLQSCYAKQVTQNNFYYVECRLLRPNWTHGLAYAYICSHSSNSPFLGEEGTQEGQLLYGGAIPLPRRPAVLLLLLKSTCKGAPLSTSSVESSPWHLPRWKEDKSLKLHFLSFGPTGNK